MAMSKARVWVLLGFVLVIGLVAGSAVAFLLTTSGEPQIRNATLEVGGVAPEFRLADHTGGFVRLSDCRGENNIVIAFYPLAWTPV